MVVVVGRGGGQVSKHGKHRFHYDNCEKNRIKIIKKIIRPRYGRLVYPYCQARLSHRLLLNKKRGAKKKASLSQKLVYVMASLCDRLLYKHHYKILFPGGPDPLS